MSRHARRSLLRRFLDVALSREPVTAPIPVQPPEPELVPLLEGSAIPAFLKRFEEAKTRPAVWEVRTPWGSTVPTAPPPPMPENAERSAT